MPAVLEVELLSAGLKAFPQGAAHGFAVGQDHPVAEDRGGGGPAHYQSRRDLEPEQVGVDSAEKWAGPEPQFPGHHPGRLQRKLEAVPL